MRRPSRLYTGEDRSTDYELARLRLLRQRHLEQMEAADTLIEDHRLGDNRPIPRFVQPRRLPVRAPSPANPLAQLLDDPFFKTGRN